MVFYLKKGFSTQTFKIAHLHSVCVCVCLVFVFLFFFSSCALHIPITRIHTQHSHVYSIYLQQIDTPVCRSFLARLLVCSVGICSVIMLVVVGAASWLLRNRVELSEQRSVACVFFFFSHVLIMPSLSLFFRMQCMYLFYFLNLQQHCCITFSFTNNSVKLLQLLLLLLMFVCFVHRYKHTHNS